MSKKCFTYLKEVTMSLVFSATENVKLLYGVPKGPQ